MREITEVSSSNIDGLKGKVDKSVAKSIIYFKGKTYKIWYEELRNLGLNYKSEIEALAEGYGLMRASFFGRDCFLCNNHKGGISKIMQTGLVKPGDALILNKRPKNQDNCEYQSTLDLKVAEEAQNNNKKSQKFYAVAKNCAFEDALISCLIEKGVLEPYRVDREFNFRPLSDFEQGLAKPEDYKTRK